MQQGWQQDSHVNRYRLWKWWQRAGRFVYPQLRLFKK